MQGEGDASALLPGNRLLLEDSDYFVDCPQSAISGNNESGSSQYGGGVKGDTCQHDYSSKKDFCVSAKLRAVML